MRWIIREWPGPSADGLGPRMALNTGRPSTDPRMARHGQAVHGYQAIRGWPGSAYGPEQMSYSVEFAVAISRQCDASANTLPGWVVVRMLDFHMTRIRVYGDTRLLPLLIFLYIPRCGRYLLWDGDVFLPFHLL